MNKDLENQGDKLLLHSLADVVQEEQQKTQDLQNSVENLENTIENINLEVPTNTSDLNNDSGFITNEDLPSVPTKTSELENDSGFVTGNDLQTTINNLGESMINTTDLENGLENLSTTNSNIGTKIDALTVAVRGIGADFTQVEVDASDVKSGKKFFDDEGILQEGAIPTFDGDTTITENGTVETGGKFVEEDLTVAVPRPQLNPPTISLSGDILTISNPASNGAFPVDFAIVANNEIISTTNSSTINLSDHILVDGTYTIYVISSNINFISSGQSNSVTFVRENPVITNITQISTLLNDYQIEQDFNTSTEEKLQFGTLLGNTPCAKIWFRQKPTNLSNMQIDLQFFITGLTTPTAIPATIKLNNTTVFSGNLTLVSGQDYLATCTVNITSGFVPFNELTVEFTDTTQATAYLDYVNISISGTRNCIVLNRDTSFELAGLLKSNGDTKEFARVYENGGINKWYGEINIDFSNIPPAQPLKYSTINNELIRYAMAYGYIFVDNNTYYMSANGYYETCYITQNDNMTVNYLALNDTTIFATNVCYAKKSHFNGSLNALGLYACLHNDFEPFIVSCDTQPSYKKYPQGTTWTFTLNDYALPKEFIDIIPVQDYYYRNRQSSSFQLGYFLIHKSGNIFFCPDVNSTYFIKIGKGKQVNAYAQSDGLNINIYYNRDNIVYKKTLSRVSTISTEWILNNTTITYNNLKEIREILSNKISVDKNNQINYINN